MILYYRCFLDCGTLILVIIEAPAVPNKMKSCPGPGNSSPLGSSRSRSMGALRCIFRRDTFGPALGTSKLWGLDRGALVLRQHLDPGRIEHPHSRSSSHGQFFKLSSPIPGAQARQTSSCPQALSYVGVRQRHRLNPLCTWTCAVAIYGLMVDNAGLCKLSFEHTPIALVAAFCAAQRRFGAVRDFKQGSLLRILYGWSWVHSGP